MQQDDLADRPICRNRNHDRRLVDQNIGNLRAVRVFNPGCPRFPALARFLHSEIGPRGDRNETAPRKVAEGAAFGHGEPGRGRRGASGLCCLRRLFAPMRIGEVPSLDYLGISVAPLRQTERVRPRARKE